MPHQIPARAGFPEFMRHRLDGKSWAVVKQRRGKASVKYDVLLLPRQYSALVAEFNGLPSPN